MKKRESAYGVALCALLAALGVAVMLAAGLIPVLTYCAPLIASAFLVPALREFGKGRAWATWAVTAVLSVILCADREAAFFYVFLGYYPILKPAFDRLGRAGWIAKLLYSAAALLAMYALVLLASGPGAEADGTGFMIALYAALAAVMLLFDAALGRIAALYERRLRKRLFQNAARQGRT